jgi:2,3-bisphosphoglycerate-dependent phosphoglycerate mutase
VKAAGSQIVIPMKLILARHGETEENAAGILMGHMPGKLTWRGVEQARRLGLALKNERIDVAYSSDLKRAVDTAKVVLTYHPKTPLVLTKELRERDCGAATGKKKDELAIPKGVSAASFPFEGAETSKELRARAGEFLQGIAKKHPEETVLVISHNGFLKAIVTILEGKPLRAIEDVNIMGNCVPLFYSVGKDGSVEPAGQ